jgi:hypothetical protein
MAGLHGTRSIALVYRYSLLMRIALMPNPTGIVEHRAVIFFILSNDISLTYYVPVIL